MKRIKYSLLSIISLLMIWSCNSEFEETNTDPNKLTEITAGSALNPVIYEMARRNAVQFRNIGAPVTQMFMRTDDYINVPFLYDFTENIGASTWNTYYIQLNNLKEMEAAALKDELPNYEAIALTLRAYGLSMLSDCFGDVPMNDAFQAEEGSWFPVFTPQEEIYTQILEDLEYANSLYDEDVTMPYVEDILFQNDVLKWKKFTNSLHLRLLLRISNRPETNAFSKMVDIINNPTQYPIFTGSDDEAVIEITGVAPLLSPWDRPQDFGTFRYYSEFFIDKLNDFEDPRRSIYAGTANGQNNEDYGYIGEPIDYINESLPDSIATASNVLNSLAEAPLIIPIMSYAEVEFIKAELAQKGYLGNAQQHYENGVRAAIEMWGVDFPADYFNNSATAYDGTLEQIMLQKYFALFFTDYQAWLEHRRTNLPDLPTTTAMSNSQEMPSRLYYPLDAADRNYQNYQEAVNRMGGDEINVKVWWDQ
ncbi:MAG: SusD/RagB family nutrient-binding outer membrane lipoprotein [Psychroflexus halocasei]